MTFVDGIHRPHMVWSGDIYHKKKENISDKFNGP